MAETTTPVEAALAWLLELAREGRAPTQDEVRARFSPTFLAKVPPDEVIDVLTPDEPAPDLVWTGLSVRSPWEAVATQPTDLAHGDSRERPARRARA